MSDITLYMVDGVVDVDAVNGTLQMTDWLESYVLLALFGTNIDNEWWANLDEQVEEYKFSAETAALFESNEPASSLIRKMQGAIERDLIDLPTVGAKLESVVVTVPSYRRLRVEISILIETSDQPQVIVFERDWAKNG